MAQVFLKSANFILDGFRLNADNFDPEVRRYIQQLNSVILGRITNDNISASDFRNFLIQFADGFPKFFYWTKTLSDQDDVLFKDIVSTTLIILSNSSLTKDKISVLYNFIETPPDPNLFEEEYGSTDDEI
jgi:hypothetical protein